MSAATPTSAKVLVVDDEVEIRRVLEDLLTREGYRVSTAGDGRDALPIVLREKPDLVITDIRMPKLDGLTLCKAVRMNPETKRTPVLILTSFNTPEHLEASRVAGADDFLTKPLNAEEIKIRVRTMLKLKHAIDEVERLQQHLQSQPKPGGESQA